MQRLLTERLAGRSADAYRDLLRAEGVLPHGVPGEIALQSMVREIDAYVPIINQIVGDQGIIKKDIRVALDGFTITGMIDTTAEGSFLRFRPANIKAMDLMRAWVSHVLLQVNRPDGAVQSRHLGKKRQALFIPVTDPESVLRDLLDVYWQGLSRPMHFFPETSYVYAKEMSKKDGSEDKALDAAVNEWTGRGGYRRAEGENGAYLICFKGDAPLDAEFAALALKVFSPLLAHVKEENL
jgi:exodeoxyribonuclease V gamma subunit